MADYYSIKMRASRIIESRHPELQGTPEHISGAERVIDNNNTIENISSQFIKRALSHEKGIPDHIYLKIKKIEENSIIKLHSLPVFSLLISDHEEAEKVCKDLLLQAGISQKSLEFAIASASAGDPYGRAFTGAQVIDYTSSQFLNPGKRTIRATMMDYTPVAHEQIDIMLHQNGLAGTRMKEALVLATKVAHAPYATAEYCLSDNPDYHTGYVAITGIGYFRIPFLKKRKAVGGRIFFVHGQNFSWDRYSRYIKETTVLIEKISPIQTDIPPEEALSRFKNILSGDFNEG